MKKQLFLFLVKVVAGTIIVLLVCEIFQPFIVGVVVEAFLDKIDFSGLPIKLCTGILFIFFLYRTYVKSKEYMIRDYDAVICISVITLCYTYYRIFPQEIWSFDNFIPPFKYGDLLYMRISS